MPKGSPSHNRQKTLNPTVHDIVNGGVICCVFITAGAEPLPYDKIIA
ncbi:MAG: hypothetical protein IKT35_04210 [Clostridia bacterium]|nr:hypothetical protein [Clostridia bacterium]